MQIQDFLVTIYQPENFRPYTFSIFNADIRKFGKQWLFYDLMSAESITGQVDNCLFRFHRPQSIGRTSEEDLKDARWARMVRSASTATDSSYFYKLTLASVCNFS